MKLRTLWTLLARPLLPRCCPEQSSSNWTRNAEMLQANESLVLRTVPPAGFEPALPPPEGGALSPELRGPITRPMPEHNSECRDTHRFRAAWELTSRSAVSPAAGAGLRRARGASVPSG